MTLLPSQPNQTKAIVNTGHSHADVGFPRGKPLHSGQHQGFDLWGPLQRRKYLIALFCLIGAGLGFLYFTKTPKTYQSFTRLMITTQAPPTIVNGDMQLERVSLSKHANLISSELVLAQAVTSGKLQELPTFEDSGFAVELLKEMIEVIPDPKSDGTLTIVCEGPQPGDLPMILNQVIDSYRENLEDDTESFGKESAELIEKLSSQIMDEKRKAEKRSLELYSRLGIATVDQNGRIVNPYAKKLAETMENFDGVKSSLRSLTDRFRMLELAVESNDENQIKVVSIEASKYLGLDRSGFASEIGGKSVSTTQTLRLPGMLSRNDLESRVWQFKTSLDELTLERAQLNQTFGAGHKRVKALDERIAYYRGEMQGMQEQLDMYTVEAEKLQQDQNDPDAPPMDLESLRMQEERQWIVWYQMALEREQQRLIMERDALAQEVQSLSGKAEAIAQDVRELNLLQTQIAEKGDAVRVILDQLSGLELVSNSYTTTKVKVLDPASHGRIIAPSLPKSLALGTMLAFLVGFGLAIMVDQGELSFHSPHEISDKLKIPVVGRIPRINIRKIQPTKGAPSLVVAHSPGSTVAEAVRDIRTSLFFQAAAEDIKTILFTSPSPGDGKSTTVANLAISIAQAGKRVVLVDADFRRPRIDKYFDEPMSPGLVDILTGESLLSDAIQKTELQENLFLLTAGGRPKNPGELVTSEAFREMLQALREKFDFVLIDSPPVLPVSDPATIASAVDGVYMVTRIRKGIRLTAQRAKETLDRVGTHWMGVIINGLDENPHYSEYGYQYGAYSYYGGIYGKYYEADNKEYREKITSK